MKSISILALMGLALTACAAPPATKMFDADGNVTTIVDYVSNEVAGVVQTNHTGDVSISGALDVGGGASITGDTTLMADDIALSGTSTLKHGGFSGDYGPYGYRISYYYGVDGLSLEDYNGSNTVLSTTEFTFQGTTWTELPDTSLMLKRVWHSENESWAVEGPSLTFTNSVAVAGSLSLMGTATVENGLLKAVEDAPDSDEYYWPRGQNDDRYLLQSSGITTNINNLVIVNGQITGTY